MKLRGKLLLVAIVPLVAALGLTALVLRQQQADLATRQRELVRHSYYESTQAELRHYVALALSTVSPYYNTGRDDEQMKRLARYQLADLDYGPDGYFFLYDFDGTNLMHSRQPELQGKNLMEFRDANGTQVIHDMIDKARAGGGFIEYTWNKPSAGKEVAKLAYVTALDRWHWMIGTGIYTDDLDKITMEIDRQLESNLDATMRWMALTAVAAVAIVMASILILSISELRAADAKLTLLARQLVRSQEDERAWLSRELHDGTSQMLVSAKLLTESALDRLAPAENEVRPVLQRALARVSDAVDDVRNISHRLRPAELDTLGLTAALRELGDEMCVPAGIAFEWQEGEEEGELPDEIRTTLFRVSQEALTNVHKHARARRVRMALQTNAAGLRLRIDDDGQGFDSQAVAQHPRRGIGLRNMRERLMAIGGSLHIASRPGETSIVADVPVDAIARLRNAA